MAATLSCDHCGAVIQQVEAGRPDWIVRPSIYCDRCKARGEEIERLRRHIYDEETLAAYNRAEQRIREIGA